MDKPIKYIKQMRHLIPTLSLAVREQDLSEYETTKLLGYIDCVSDSLISLHDLVAVHTEENDPNKIPKEKFETEVISLLKRIEMFAIKGDNGKWA